MTYVLVTVAANGIKHAWGPFETRGKADTLKRRFQRDNDEYYRGPIEYMVLKVLNPAVAS